jgi:hypothetical protein
MEVLLIQKTSKPVVNRVKTGQRPAEFYNQWYRSMNKIDEPVEIHYFDSTKYPAATIE